MSDDNIIDLNKRTKPRVKQAQEEIIAFMEAENELVSLWLKITDRLIEKHGFTATRLANFIRDDDEGAA